MGIPPCSLLISPPEGEERFTAAQDHQTTQGLDMANLYPSTNVGIKLEVSPKEGQSTLEKKMTSKAAGKHFSSGGLTGGQEVGEKRQGANRNKPLSQGGSSPSKLQPSTWPPGR